MWFLVAVCFCLFVFVCSCLFVCFVLVSVFFAFFFFFFLLFFSFYNCIVPVGFLLWAIRVAFPGDSQLRQSRATQPSVHAGCFSVSVIHRTLTWTTRSLRCAQTLMHSGAHRTRTGTVRVSVLKVNSGRKIPCRTRESNLRQRHDGPILYR